MSGEEIYERVRDIKTQFGKKRYQAIRTPLQTKAMEKANGREKVKTKAKTMRKTKSNASASANTKTKTS